ncbi:MAG: ABC transporter ATP-binding protein, partial [Rhodospirillales bacterium]|nr:ABC transporter ATP-binding protein [Rhodospirillales bacterium]
MAIASVYVGENVAWVATNQLRSDLARHCLHLDMSYHNDHSPGELIERIDNDIVQLSNFFSQLVVRVIGNLLLLVGILLVLFAEDWRIGAAFTVLAVTSIVLLNKVRSIAVEPEKPRLIVLTDIGGDPDVGHRLGNMLYDAGFRTIEVQPYPMFFDKRQRE